MRYLITITGGNPFFTDNFNFHEDWNFEKGMIAFDLLRNKYTRDGNGWLEIEK